MRLPFLLKIYLIKVGKTMINKKTFRIAISAIFVAIILVQTFVPYIGYIRILPGLPSITTIPLTVALAGCLMGPGFGTSIGLFWGLLSLFIAYTQPGDIVSMLLFRNIFIALVPRAAAGFIAGMIGQAAKDESKLQKTVVYTIAGLCTSLANTLLVISITSLWFMNNPAALLQSLGQTQNSAPLIAILLSVLVVNGVVEAIFTAILTPAIAMPLKQVMKRKMS